MNNLDIIALFAMDNSVNDRNNVLRLMLNKFIEVLPELDELEVRQLLAKAESFLAAGDLFGLPKSIGHYVLYNRPDRRRCHEEEIIFRRRFSHGFLGVVGIIDGCHIPIKAPADSSSIDFYNRNKVHLIILQGVCDLKARFINVFIEMPGRMHNARIFRQSELFVKLNNVENILLPSNMHLLEDSAYPLMKNLMTPFHDNGHLTREQTFGLLKGKFRRLKYLDIFDPVLENTVIATASVIHNFLIDLHEIDFEHKVPIEEPMLIPNDDRDVVPDKDLLAIAKRNRIVNFVTMHHPIVSNTSPVGSLPPGERQSGQKQRRLRLIFNNNKHGREINNRPPSSAERSWKTPNALNGKNSAPFPPPRRRRE
ncbi:hypothetical protein ACFW04_011078 [Cataglyphis niger]